ncbi:phosphoribosylaminoimidazolesuccinocarboxamide synthase [Candidatus Pseudothioglobus singularis]|uniref:Phosphoribosylaminoimidazole-succinocarboxamide synthase n=1 Tax=Candidatus Pseudothioglobus singularis PS1 TaxID=1125411 RepID=A0A0M4LGQ1_9GAMM|nr:phosphoribosylaminoimidazolesuccinocarboxamide synthase [Candidatus Pseudothioglobus singularis]ALE02568.1 phosphoribosylaminoimidazole-succinocarboxamide synthase [Candidatus Pseudothioglobus singularis PS1]
MSSPIRLDLSLPLLHQGKVRDIYDIDSQYMLIVATDRLSAFDVIFDQPIASKGKILTEIANFWFDKTKHIVQNHLTKIKPEEVLTAKEAETLSGRAIVVKKLKPLPVEAVVRGYLIGSGWKEYKESQSVCGIALPEDLRLAGRLEKPIFTPSSKAAVGEHDANISFEEVESLIGIDLAKEMKEVSLEIYSFASKLAIEKGIIIADTKLEFGLDSNDQLTLMDEVLTPDSSRFWSLPDYTPGISPISFDKQIIRDYLETLDWNKAPPAPKIPQKIMRQAANKYMDIQSILCN